MPILNIDDSTPAEQIISAPSLTLALPRVPIRFYRHGWQSWSLAAWLDAKAGLPVPKPSVLHASQHDPLYASDPNLHGSWVGAVDLGSETLLLSSLGLDAHVTLRGNQLDGHYDSGTGEWFIARGEEATVFAKYADELSKQFGRKSTKALPRVWCSWYSL